MANNRIDTSNLSWAEYVVFSAVLASSCAFGIYYGCFGTKQKSTKEYLLANRKMSSVPVALSLICSAVSAITLIANPAEIYFYGTQYVMVFLSFIPFNLALAYLYIPIYFNLNLNSAYEYIELRFNPTVRFLVSGLAVVHAVTSMSIAIYGPSLAIEQVTGIHPRWSTAAIYITCIFYSSLGGLKAVLWTDALQAVIMLASLAAIAIKALVDIGGFGVVWERLENAGRVEFLNFDPDPRTRHTIWTCLFAGYFFWLPSFASTQLQVQRFLSMPTMSRVKRALVMNLCGLFVIVALTFFTGMIMVAKYYDCDPFTVHNLKSDQMLPYFVAETVKDIDGLLGLFIGGLCAASMSSLSSALTALASITTFDYVSKFFPHLSDTKLSRISKINCFLLGMLSYFFVFVVEQMGSILSTTSSLLGLMLGPTLGIFSLGMFFPMANAKGSLLGICTTFIVMITFIVGNTIASSKGLLPNQRLELRTNGCKSNDTTSFFVPNGTSDWISLNPAEEIVNDWKNQDDSFLIKILSISYMWYSAMGCILTVFFGLIYSFIIYKLEKRTGKISKVKVSSKCLSPPIVTMWKKLLSKSRFDYWIDENNISISISKH